MIERIEVATFLAPFPISATGDNVREGGAGSDVYLRIKDERAAARLAERDASNGSSDGDPLSAGLGSWVALAEGATAILTERSKDLEVAAWLTEALLRTGGIAGIADGFALLDGLIETFWDDGLWPAADEDGDEGRLAPLFGLFGRGGTGTLLQPLRLVPLSDRSGDRVTLWSTELAFAPPPPRVADEDAQAVIDERRNAAIDAVTTGIGRSSQAFLIALHRSLTHAVSALERLMQTIDRVSTVGAFGSQIAEPLTAAIKLLEDHAGLVLITAATVAPPEDGSVPDAPTSVGTVAGGEPRSREAALNAVLTLADYFEQAEPQSPISLSLREAVRRARLPLEALLSELLPDAAMRTLFLQRAGIRSAISGVDAYE